MQVFARVCLTAEPLRYRYARGEISETEFEQAMQLIGYERVP